MIFDCDFIQFSLSLSMSLSLFQFHDLIVESLTLKRSLNLSLFLCNVMNNGFDFLVTIALPYCCNHSFFVRSNFKIISCIFIWQKTSVKSLFIAFSSYEQSHLCFTTKICHQILSISSSTSVQLQLLSNRCNNNSMSKCSLIRLQSNIFKTNIQHNSWLQLC